MIVQLRGEVVEKGDSWLVIDVAGVGYEVLVPEIDLDQFQLEEDVLLYTYFHVRENSQELFGFSSSGAKNLFKQLIGVNGVGPKSALAIMGLGDEKQIKSAIGSGNIAFITAASGVGKKAAEKVVLELKDKVGVMAGQVIEDIPSGGDDALEALISLGYTRAHSAQALAKVGEGSTEDRVKLSLKELAK